MSAGLSVVGFVLAKMWMLAKLKIGRGGVIDKESEYVCIESRKQEREKSL